MTLEINLLFMVFVKCVWLLTTLVTTNSAKTIVVFEFWKVSLVKLLYFYYLP